MNEEVELGALLKAHQGELKAVAEAAAAGNTGRLIDAASSLAVSLATGSPLLGALAPLGRKELARAFGNSVNAALTRELAAVAKAQERRAELQEIEAVVEALLGEVLIQIVRSQHALHDARGPLAEACATVRVEVLTVSGGGIGVRATSATTQQVALSRMDVTGVGSVGIELT